MNLYVDWDKKAGGQSGHLAQFVLMSIDHINTI